MEEVALTEAALDLAETLGIETRIGSHAVQFIGIAKAILEDRLVNDGHAASLRQQDGERLLPVGHEAGVDIRFQSDGARRVIRAEEADGVILDAEVQPNTVEGIEEREKRILI